MLNKILTGTFESIAKALLGVVLLVLMGYAFIYLFIILAYLGVIPIA